VPSPNARSVSRSALDPRSPIVARRPGEERLRPPPRFRAKIAAPPPFFSTVRCAPCGTASAVLGSGGTHPGGRCSTAASPDPRCVARGPSPWLSTTSAFGGGGPRSVGGGPGGGGGFGLAGASVGSRSTADSFGAVERRRFPFSSFERAPPLPCVGMGRIGGYERGERAEDLLFSKLHTSLLALAFQSD
jgi:hypothetical protein